MCFLSLNFFNFSLFTEQGDSSTNSKSCSIAIESSLKSVHERSEKKDNNNNKDTNDKNDDNNNDDNNNKNKDDKKVKSLDESSLRIPIFRPVFVQPNSYKRHYPFTAAEKQEERKLKNEKSSSSLRPKKSGRNDDEDDDERFSRPCPLISTAAVHVGKYFLIFGGFNNRLRERAEIWVRYVESYMPLFTTHFHNYLLHAIFLCLFMYRFYSHSFDCIAKYLSLCILLLLYDATTQQHVCSILLLLIIS